MLDRTTDRSRGDMSECEACERGGAAAVPVLQARGVSKAYGSVTVLADVTLEIIPGEVHAIIGENGAGKSTLMCLLSGYAEPSGGKLLMDGREITFAGPTEAEEAGVVLVHQEILLAEALTVAENLFLGGNGRNED